MRETLLRSYLAQKQSGVIHEGIGGYWCSPDTFWEAMDGPAMGPVGLHKILWLYNRLMALDATGQLWRDIRYVGHWWCGSSLGCKVVWEGAGETYGDHYLKHPAIAKDRLLGKLEHGGAYTYREVVKDPRQGGLHWCIDRHEHGPENNLHYDWITPCIGRDDTRHCRYSLRWAIPHGLHVLFNRAYPPDAMALLWAAFQELHATAQSITANTHWLKEFLQMTEKQLYRLIPLGQQAVEPALQLRDKIKVAHHFFTSTL